jgi:hypothetical protein
MDAAKSESMRQLRLIGDMERTYGTAVELRTIDVLSERLRSLPKELVRELQEEGDQIYG